MLQDVTAIDMIHEMIAAEIEVVKAINTTRGASKKAEARERKAAQNLFRELVGTEPTDAQLLKMCSY